MGSVFRDPLIEEARNGDNGSRKNMQLLIEPFYLQYDDKKRSETSG